MAADPTDAPALDAAVDGVDAGDLSAAIRMLLDADRTAVVLLDRQRQVRAANTTALTLFGAGSLDDLHPERAGHARLQSLLDQAPSHLARGETTGVWQGDVDLYGPGGERLVHRATVLVRDGNGTRDGNGNGTGNSNGDRVGDGGFIGVVAHDVTFARQESARLRQRAMHDGLTGLANRRQILATLSRAISQQRARSGHVAAVFVDLDRLKYVNDALGHQVGDQLLVATSRRLAGVVRPQDHVARIGGDEFLVVCTDIVDETDALDIAERLRSALSGRLRLRQLDVSISVSIGVALVDPTDSPASDAVLASTLISNSDTAMYEAKSGGRGRSVLFTPAMQQATRERTALGAELSRAIDDGRLRVEYQPVFSAVSGQAVAAEALARWNHPLRGTVDPSEFITVAEQSGTIGKLGQAVLEGALAQLARWRHDGRVGDDFALHVNVSPVQLASASFVNLVTDLATRHDARLEQLVFETRHATLLGRNEDVDRSVRALRRLGVRFAIDNFGTGARALSVLSDVGADILKLDASSALTASPGDDTRLVRAIVVLAHALDMRVVAERIDSVELLEQLRAAGCDLLQGNVLAPPGPADALVTTSIP